ncbi:MAG: GNAT family N-acetyltransferase [Vicinamibacterales bacterium]
MSSFRIVDLSPDDPARLMSVADVLVDGFTGSGAEVWQTPEEALETVEESFGEDRISRVAVDEDGRVLGWIGAVETYGGHVWEIHPLVVRRDCQGLGVGRALVEDLERQVRERGGMTVCLGTDDENGRTSIGGLDLYPDPLAAAQQLEDLGGHPFAFYRRLGYAVVGVLPDANGYGKPDILMAKRVGEAPASTAAQALEPAAVGE